MTLPSSGTISISQIATEFGDDGTHSLSEYYRGGSYVTANNTNVPTSGAIALSDFYLRDQEPSPFKLRVMLRAELLIIW